MDKRNDTDLVKLAASGDSDAFTELVRRYRDAVYGYCYYRTGSFEDARDVCQETFILAYRKLSQIREGTKLGAWLHRIAANLCTRWSAGRREVPMPELLPQPPLEPPKAACVREALSALPDQERLAVVMHYVDGLSYSEIAGFLETNVTAIKGRLYRGRVMLREGVLRMTEETFGVNRLGEEFVVQAVNAAVQKAADAYNMLGDKTQSKKEVDEAVALVDGVSPAQIKDPVTLAGALLSLGCREFVLGESDKAHEHWDRAKSLFEQAGERDGIEQWRSEIAYEKMLTGDLADAHELYLQSAGYWLDQIQISKEQKTAGFGDLAIARALEAIGLDTDSERIADFHAGSGWLEHQDDQIICGGGAHSGFTKDSYPARLRTRLGPPIGPTPLPLALIRDQPAAGDTLRFVNQDGWAEESVLESLSETVTTPADTFRDCACSSSRVFASNKWEGDVIAFRKLWFAPGIGIVRIAYQAAGEPADTLELAAFHIQTPDNVYLPLSVGNWWKWRWMEAQEQYGLRTESYREVVQESDERWVALLYTFAVKE